MTTKNTALSKEIKKIERQITALNNRIDMKIISGKNYKTESAKHRDLVAYYKTLTVVA